MSSVRLVQIGPRGLPIEATGALPEVAQQACRDTASLYQRAGFAPPWIGYLVLLDREIAGTCAFKTPLREGKVEIAYFTFPQFEERGIGTTMARGLIGIARFAKTTMTVTAQTLTEA